MSNTSLPIFKTWAPEWLIRLTIFLVLLPALGIFALYFSNGAETAGYYGMEPADVQYSVMVMYATLVAFLPLDDRFVKYLKPRQYFLIGIGLNTLTFLICANTRNVSVFMVCRFIQGIVCAPFCSLCLHLIFSRLHVTRMRVIGYAVFYGSLQVAIPGCAIFCSWMLYYFEFNMLFYALIIVEIPGVILFLLITNNVRLRKKFPLYQIDWVSYLFYTVMLCVVAWIFVYGQQLNWLDSPLVLQLMALVAVTLVLFVIRQLHLKRPFINIRLFRFADFRNGLLLLMAYYIFKGTTGFAYSYLQGVGGLYPVHLTPVLLMNIAGIVAGMLISSRFILHGMVLNKILIGGFMCLLLYHVQMYFLFSSTAATTDFFLPMLLQGLGSGVLFVPLVLFTVSAVPAPLAGAVSFIGIAARFTGFCISIAVANYFQLFNKSIHYNRFRENITALNPAMDETINSIQASIANSGQDAATAKMLSSGMLNRAVTEQVALRAAMDYYGMMIWALSVFIVLLAVLPSARRAMLYYTRKFIPY